MPQARERERAEFRDFAASNVIEQFLPSWITSPWRLSQRHRTAASFGRRTDRQADGRDTAPVAGNSGCRRGEAFDPRVHEAIGTVDRDDLPDQHVAEEVRRGYKLRDRLLRQRWCALPTTPNSKANSFHLNLE